MKFLVNEQSDMMTIGEHQIRYRAYLEAYPEAKKLT